VPKNLREKEIYFIHDSTQYAQDWLVELFLANDLFLLASASELNYVLPDIKYDRQDRKHQPRVPVSSTILPNFLKNYWPKVKRVFTMDLHSPQLVGYYDPIPIEALPSSPMVVKFLREKSGIPNLEEMVIVAADKGDANRAEDLSNRLNSINPPAYIYKQRNNITRKVTRMDLVGDVKGKRALVPDDIIDKGTTICKAGELLLEKGATEIICYATHGWFTKGTESITNLFNRTMVSNTHNKNYGDKIEVIDMSPRFAEAIYRAQTGESVSELY
jgi:ribose-phosphate pyrophosphokinase